MNFPDVTTFLELLKVPFLEHTKFQALKRPPFDFENSTRRGAWGGFLPVSGDTQCEVNKYHNSVLPTSNL